MPQAQGKANGSRAGEAAHGRELPARPAEDPVARATRERLVVAGVAGTPWIERRLRELDQEWDVDRAMALGAGLATAVGVLGGVLGGRGWFVLAALVPPNLVLHALGGWSPAAAMLRGWGLRTRREIEDERTALRALLGRFEGAALGRGEASEQVARAWQAATA